MEQGLLASRSDPPHSPLSMSQLKALRPRSNILNDPKCSCGHVFRWRLIESTCCHVLAELVCQPYNLGVRRSCGGGGGVGAAAASAGRGRGRGGGGGTVVLAAAAAAVTGVMLKIRRAVG